MTNIFWTKLTLISALCFSMGANAEDYVGKHNGDYFSVTFPEDFTAIEINGDEVRIVSPDESVEFYVYSPLWDGQPATYLEIWETEELADESSTITIKEDVYRDNVQTRWVTAQARDGSYIRSYMYQRSCNTSELLDCVSYAFGIKYRDQQAYARYRDAYKAFKASLVQFSD